MIFQILFCIMSSDCLWWMFTILQFFWEYMETYFTVWNVFFSAKIHHFCKDKTIGKKIIKKNSLQQNTAYESWI
jgi:hypothetical protein